MCDLNFAYQNVFNVCIFHLVLNSQFLESKEPFRNVLPQVICLVIGDSVYRTSLSQGIEVL